MNASKKLYQENLFFTYQMMYETYKGFFIKKLERQLKYKKNTFFTIFESNKNNLLTKA